MNDFKELIEEVKSRCDIASVIGSYIKLSQSGHNYKGLCPFHGEKTPSFYVSTSKQMYKCFGCGEGGDVIKFVMQMENLEFIDAIKVLGDRYGIDVNTNLTEKDKLYIKKIKRYQEIHMEVARMYFYKLINTKNEGYKYLIERGLDEKTIKKFGLGYSSDSWNELMNTMISKGYSKEELIECGLLSKSAQKQATYDKFRNRVMFPIFDYRGNVIGFGGRVLDNSEPKYLNSPETIIFNKRLNLYGLNFSRKEIKNNILILVEGYMDLISMYQYGVKNVVATLGTALTEEQALLIKRYAQTAIISYDSDSAGVKATLRAIDILVKQGINVKVLSLKDCKDPDDFMRKYGVNKYEQAVKDAISHIKFKINVLKNEYNLQEDEDKIKFTKESVKIIKTLKSPIDID